MNRKKYFDYIEERLTWLSVRVASRGALNMYDINIHCEDFYMHLLNLLYNWNLINANAIQHNTPAIDLIYNGENIIVQVSSTNTANKIQTSLDKLEKKYANYNFKFISIAKPVKKLRGHSFNIPTGLNVVFNPQEDIYDIASILEKIKSLSITEIKPIYDFIHKELNFESNELKLETGLAHVINELSAINLQSDAINFDTLSFDLENKITKNNLSVFKGVIEQYDVYYNVVQKIYNEFDALGNNKSFAVLQTINKVYLQLKPQFSGDLLYSAIVENLKEKLSLSANLKQFHTEDLELYVDIILVDAFIRCKIFEKP